MPYPLVLKTSALTLTGPASVTVPAVPPKLAVMVLELVLVYVCCDVAAVGSVVQIRLDGTSTGDQQVQAIQNARRQIIPASGEGIPAPIASAIAAGVDAAFREIV